MHCFKVVCEQQKRVNFNEFYWFSLFGPDCSVTPHLYTTPINTYFYRTLPVAASDFSGNMQIFKRSVFYESLPLKLPVTFPENFLWKYVLLTCCLLMFYFYLRERNSYDGIFSLFANSSIFLFFLCKLEYVFIFSRISFKMLEFKPLCKKKKSSVKISFDLFLL